MLAQYCELCDARGAHRGLCAGCRRDLASLGPACQRCAMPGTTPLCWACLRRPPPVDAMHVPYRYQFPLDRLLHRFKYADGLELANLMAGLLIDSAGALDPADAPNCLIPVPLHRTRLRARGYNQSLELATRIGRALGIAVAPTSCTRVRATPAQAGLSAQERATNLRSAFAFSHGATAPRVAIVDDVVTTGATVFELARVLRQAGAKHVQVWAIARSLPGR